MSNRPEKLNRVRIVGPEYVLRVGYKFVPSSFEDMIARQEVAKMVLDHIHKARKIAGLESYNPPKDLFSIFQNFEEVENAICAVMAKAVHFGGPERMLHKRPVGEMAGKTGIVCGVLRKQTGTRQGGSSDEPPFLSDVKTHKLYRVMFQFRVKEPPSKGNWSGKEWWFEREALEPIEDKYTFGVIG